MEKRGPIREEAVQQALTSIAGRRILAECIRRALSVRDLSQATGLPLASTYRQVHLLQELGVIVIERSAMTPDGKPYDLYRSRVRTARIEVTPNRVQVTWEPNLPVEDRLVNMWDQLGG